MTDFVKAAETSDIPAGRVKVVEVDGKRIALCNVDGEFYAIDDLCTHDDGPLDQGELTGDVIECPRHGARFNVRTGKVLALPAVKPLGTYALKVEGTQIRVALP
ncbi:MAG: non-heme iron oxygenase ferredoxin subunit [Chloroflexota bacterium]|nr:non-heme iron oxygenase ferredoxin subunit [Chloroflexota bacterium]